METSLDRAVIRHLAHTTSLGLLITLPTLTLLQSVGVGIPTNTHIVDPNDDDRGSGRVAAVHPVLLSWRGSGRVGADPTQQASPVRPMAPPLAYRGTGRLGGDASEQAAYRVTGRLGGDASEQVAYRGTGRLGGDASEQAAYRGSPVG